MRDGRLAWKLVRGAGRRDAVLLGATALGIALTVAALLLALLCPIVMERQRATESNRHPVSSSADTNGAVTGARLITSHELLDRRPYLHVAVAGASPESPLPPGLAAWPQVGHSSVSPALLDLVRAQPGLADELGLGTVDDTALERAGVTHPAELVSYTVVDDRPRPGGVARYGDGRHERAQTPATMLAAEIGTLVGVPALLFLGLCLRATARSRIRRYRSLTVMGVSRRRCASLYARELSLVAALGVALGGGTFALVQGPLGESGALGSSWWAVDGTLSAGSVLSLVVVAVVVLLVVRALARWAMLTALRSPVRRAQLPRGLRALLQVGALGGAAAAFAVLAYLTVVIMQSRTGVIVRPESALYTRTLLVLLAALLLVPLATVPLASAAARRLDGGSPVVRHAGRLCRHQWSTFAPLAASMALAVLLAAMGQAFVAWTNLVAYKRGPVREVTVRDLAPQETEAIRRMSGRLGVRAFAPVSDEVVVIVEGHRCGTASDIPCPPLSSRATDLPARGVLEVPLMTGGNRKVDLATLRSDSSLPLDTVSLDLDTNDWLWRTDQPEVTFPVHDTPAEVAGVLGKIHRAAPMAHVSAGGSADTEQLAREQAMVLGTGAGGCITLLLGSFLLVMAQARAATRRSLNALVAAGTPLSFLRTSFALSVTLPVLVGGAVGSVAAVVCGWAMLSLFGREQMTSATVVAGTAPAALAVVVCWCWGWWAGGHRFDRQLLVD